MFEMICQLLFLTSYLFNFILCYFSLPCQKDGSAAKSNRFAAFTKNASRDTSRVNSNFILLLRREEKPCSSGQVAEQPEEQENTNHKIDNDGLGAGRKALSCFHIPDRHLQGDHKARGKQQEYSRIGPECRFKVETEEGEAHAAYTAAGAVKSCDFMEQAGDQGASRQSA